YKDSPSFAEPFTDDERQVVSTLVMDAYNHFVAMIAERRHMDETQVRALADGRVYTGHQAAELKLIDGLGGNDEALAWLAKERKVNPKLEVKEVEPETKTNPLIRVLSRVSGIDFLGSSAVGLDGLVSIWHPSLAQ